MSGVFWPIEAVPNYFRYAANLTPLTHPLNGLRAIMLRGWTYTRPAVYYGYIVMFIYTIVLNILNIILFQVFNDKSISLNFWQN